MARSASRKDLTKEDLRLIVNQWDSRSVHEIADIIGCTTNTIYRVARIMREKGIKMSQKIRKGYINNLIEEVAQEF